MLIDEKFTKSTMSINKRQYGNTNYNDHEETSSQSSDDAGEQRTYEIPIRMIKKMKFSNSGSESYLKVYFPVSQNEKKKKSSSQTKSITIPPSISPLRNQPELNTRKFSKVSLSRRFSGTGKKDSLASQTRVSSSQHSRIPSQPKEKNNFNSGIKSKPEESAEKLNVEKFEPLKKLFQDTLQNRDKKNLLTIADIQVIEEYLKMDVYHQYFLMNLYLQSPIWYPFRKFCNDIKLNQKLSLEEMFKIYESHKINIFAYGHRDLIQLGTDELVSYLESEDLRQIADKFKINIKCRRKAANIVNLLKKSMVETQCQLTEELLRDEALKILGYCIKLKGEVKSSFHKVYVLQTFSNFSYCEDVKNYLNDYGKVEYPRYTIENYIPFRNKEQFSRFYVAVELHHEYNSQKKSANYEIMKKLCDEAFYKLQSIDDNGKWRRDQEDHLHKFSAEYRYISVLKDGIKECRNHYKDVKIWLEFLIAHYPTNHDIGFWYKHLAHIIFHDIKNYEAAAKVVNKALKFNKEADIFDIELNKIATSLVTTRSYKLYALYRDEIAANLTVSSSGNSPIYIDRSDILGHETSSDGDSNDGVTSATNIALKYYLDKQKYKGIFCKAKFIEILFTLFFWDIIYEFYVPKTFLSELQNAPLDMYSETFYKNRKQSIDIRLRLIASHWPEEKLETILKHQWQNYSHLKSITDLECLGKDLKKILIMFRCIDRRVLSNIFSRLVKNFKRFRGGFPNLFLWNEELWKCKFVVVRSDDSQQPDVNQWRKFLIDAGAEVEDCYVSGVGAKKIKLKNKS